MKQRSLLTTTVFASICAVILIVSVIAIYQSWHNSLVNTPQYSTRFGFTNQSQIVNNNTIRHIGLSQAFTFSNQVSHDWSSVAFVRNSNLLQALVDMQIDIAITPCSTVFANNDALIPIPAKQANTYHFIHSGTTQPISFANLSADQLTIFPELLPKAVINEIQENIALYNLEEQSLPIAELSNYISQLAGSGKVTILSSIDFYMLQHQFSSLRRGTALHAVSYPTWWVTKNNILLAEQINTFAKQMPLFISKQNVSPSFLSNARTRLPTYIDLFHTAAQQYSFPWQLIAAISYQESHWNKDAVSPTGVRGLMMLTQATAADIGITDRTNPTQSVFGGTYYLNDLFLRLPASIHDDDRTRFALAAYNIGMGHLEDARVIAQARGQDPNSWQAVRQTLPLLENPNWYSYSKFGYARGNEPVQYIARIEQYFLFLMQLHATIDDTVGILAPQPQFNITNALTSLSNIRW